MLGRKNYLIISKYKINERTEVQKLLGQRKSSCPIVPHRIHFRGPLGFLQYCRKCPCSRHLPHIGGLLLGYISSLIIFHWEELAEQVNKISKFEQKCFETIKYLGRTMRVGF